MYESDFKSTLGDNKILLNHKELLKKLSDDKVMCVGYEQDGNYYILECCDEWYNHYLTKTECIELSELFKEIAEEVTD